MRRFEFIQPQTASEAIALLVKHGARASLLAGGTDLLVEIKESIRTPDIVIDAKHIPGLHEFTVSAADGLSFGEGPRALGVTRGLEFSYLSPRAYPVPILPFQATLPKQAAIPSVIQYQLRSFGGVSGGTLPGGYISTATLNENLDESFRGAVAVDSRLSIDPPPTGIYPWSIRLTNQYGGSAVATDAQTTA